MGRLTTAGSPERRQSPCDEFMANQLGPGNNIALRIAALTGRIDTDFKTVGKQHEFFEDTLPDAERDEA